MEQTGTNGKRMAKLKFFLLLFLILLEGCELLQSSIQVPEQKNRTNETIPQPQNETTNQTNLTEPPKPVIVIQPRNNSLNFYFLNIQGDATIIQKGQESILINGGKETDSNTILKAIRDLGISQLKYIILTNPVPDTYGGIPYIVLRTNPINFYENGLSDRSSSYKLIGEVFKNTTKVPHDTILNFDDTLTKILVIYDDGKGFSSQFDDNSLIIKIIYGTQKILLMGSCDFECEERLIGEDLNADIIKISNSCSATSLTFLQRVNPKIAIVKDGCPNIEQRFINLNIPLYKIKEGDFSISVKEDNYEIFKRN